MLSGHQKGWSPMCQSVNNTENLSLKNAEMLTGVSGSMCSTCVWKSCPVTVGAIPGLLSQEKKSQHNFLPHLLFLRLAGLLLSSIRNNSHCIHSLRRGLPPSIYLPFTSARCNTESFVWPERRGDSLGGSFWTILSWKGFLFSYNSKKLTLLLLLLTLLLLLLLLS